uniref:DUF4408 domain-containing protein n=1 Tax=Nelumbo nucifera TaxID=4432 RepID=A0A822XSG7_NELNU|nr:TPA_asm: hypothetical protein HUJ06_021881 [Nelumbo nucifera]
MDKFQKSQIAKVSFIAILLLITPLLSTSMRPPYLYFLMNLLIIALGAEAGLLSSSSTPQQDKKPDHYAVVAPKPSAVFASVVAAEASPEKMTSINTNSKVAIGGKEVTDCTERKSYKAIEKSASEKIVTVVTVQKVKKCPSMPSLFFIGGGEAEAEEMTEDDEEEDEVGGLSGQELYTKAETFISNFYKQLKIQREESWKKIHGFYQKAF